MSCEYGIVLHGCIKGIAEHHRHLRNYSAWRWSVTAAHISTPKNIEGPLTNTKTMHTWVYCGDTIRSTAHRMVTQFSMTNVQTYVTFKDQCQYKFYMKPVLTTQRTQSLSIINSNLLMVFTTSIEIYIEDQMRYSNIYTVWQNAGFLYEGWNFNSGNCLFTTDTK